MSLVFNSFIAYETMLFFTCRKVDLRITSKEGSILGS